MKKISVIIPMYNSEAYIEQCIQSVVRQTYQDWELLVIDDGSTDHGAKICERLGSMDGRIRLYRQSNSGVSHARNCGLDAAQGEYVFFLDSDDAIHPLLFEEMMAQAEKTHAGLVFCNYGRFSTHKLKTVLDKISVSDARPQWETAGKKETLKWFHGKHINEMSGIGGKMVARDSVKDLRFDESLTNGEDTFFLYQLVRNGIRSAFAPCGWYYYRTHEKSVTHSETIARGRRYYECSKRIRDGEYERGCPQSALIWEIFTVQQIEKNYMMQRRSRNQKNCKRLRREAVLERRHPMFRHLYFSNKFMFYCCFYCYPAYVPLSRIVPVLLRWRERR